LEALVRILGQHFVEGLLIRLVLTRKAWHRSADMFYCNGNGFVALKRHGASEHLIKYDAEAVEVGARVNGFAAGLFRAHIMWRTNYLADAGHARYTANTFRYPEVGQYRGLVCAKQNVFRFDIAVD